MNAELIFEDRICRQTLVFVGLLLNHQCGKHAESQDTYTRPSTDMLIWSKKRNVKWSNQNNIDSHRIDLPFFSPSFLLFLFRIITMGGDLLATAGGDSNDKLVGAIVLNIWSTYKKSADDLNCLLIDCEVIIEIILYIL